MGSPVTVLDFPVLILVGSLAECCWSLSIDSIVFVPSFDGPSVPSPDIGTWDCMLCVVNGTSGSFPKMVSLRFGDIEGKVLDDGVMTSDDLKIVTSFSGFSAVVATDVSRVDNGIADPSNVRNI